MQLSFKNNYELRPLHYILKHHSSPKTKFTKQKLHQQLTILSQLTASRSAHATFSGK